MKDMDSSVITVLIMLQMDSIKDNINIWVEQIQG